MSVSGHEWTTENETRGEGMIKLTAGPTTLLQGEGAGGMLLSEQTFGLHVTGKLEIDGNSIIDMTALASATWPEVLGGPEGKYEGGMSLMEAEQELIGVSGSIEGRQTGAELKGQGEVDVRVVGETFIGGSGQMAADWSNGIAVEASMADGDQDEVIGVSVSGHEWTTENETRGEGMIKLTAGPTTLLQGEEAGGMLLSELALGLHVTGKLEIDGNSIIDMTALASATWPEVLGGPEGKYEGGMSLMEAEQELIGVSGSIEGRQTGAELKGQGEVDVRVVGETFIGGSGQMAADWSNGIAVEASMADGDQDEVIGVSVSGHEWTTENETRGEGMIKLTAGPTTLLQGEGAGGMLLSEQTFGLHGTGKLEIGDVDLGVIAEATWPEMMGGPDSKYDGMFLLTLDEQQLFGLNTSMEGEHTDSTVSTAGSIRVKILDRDDIIEGTSHLDMNWTDGLQLNALVVDTDKTETLFDMSVATAGVAADEEGVRGQGMMDLHVKISDQDNRRRSRKGFAKWDRKYCCYYWIWKSL